MPTPIHSKIINKIARKILKEYGIERKGQSRTWLDDHYWFTTVIEFQPFKDQQGTCLNVGVNFHWYLQEYFSFDIGNRLSDFIEFKNEEQFENEMVSLVELALNKTLELRTKLSDINVAEQTIITHNFASDELWGNYHRALISGLNNNTGKAITYFNKILNRESNIGWMKELKSKVEYLVKVLNEGNEFKKQVDLIIQETRIEKKLKDKEIKNVW